jgi:undecaprenyl-diphosphatase
MSPDVSLLYDINELAVDAPGWLDRIVAWAGEYGIILALTVLLTGAWWSIRKRGDRAAGGIAVLLWAPLAAGIALLVNIPIRSFVQRPRPFVDHRGLEVLATGKADFSFVSDHATLTMALAVGIFAVHRAAGSAALALAVLEGFSRVYMGVHYPTDVVGGFALGTAVVLLLAPAATALLTPLTSAVAESPIGWLVRAPRPAAGDATPDAPGQESADGRSPSGEGGATGRDGQEAARGDRGPRGNGGGEDLAA